MTRREVQESLKVRVLPNTALDAATLQSHTLTLCRTINRELPARAEPEEAPSRPGAKGDFQLLGTLAMQLFNTAAAASLIKVLGSYLLSRPEVELELEREDGAKMRLKYSDMDRETSDTVRETLRAFLGSEDGGA